MSAFKAPRVALSGWPEQPTAADHSHIWLSGAGFFLTSVTITAPKGRYHGPVLPLGKRRL